MSSISLTNTLAEAAKALKRGDHTRALRLLDGLASPHSDHPDCLQLLGLAHKASGNLQAAETCLRRSLERQRRQPGVWNNLGNVLKQLGKRSAAERAYREALNEQPGFADALKNLGLLLAGLDRTEEAVPVLAQAAEQRPQDHGVWTSLGQCHRRLGDFDQSVACFQRAIRIQPGHSNAFAGLGQTLRMMGRPADAAMCFDKAQELGAGSVELKVARADVAADDGRYEEAVSRYRQILRDAPTHTAAHVQLSDLLWQTGASTTFGESFRRALEAYPDNADLLAAWCEGLANTGAGEEALRELEQRRELVERHPLLLGALAKRQAAQNDTADATRSFRQALGKSPDHPDLSLDFAQFAIYQGNYEDALAALQVTERARPDDQLLWACRGLCWRLMGDERWAWLNDDDLLVRTMEIQPPSGYGSLPQFLQALSDTLAELHRTQAAPAHQSLRGGTQTAARLFYRPEKVIQDLRHALFQAVVRYIDDLPEDSTHPLLRRLSRHFQFAGSWSVRLRSGGFHVNHVHPQGWISSSHYVCVPDDIGAGEDDPAGWLKFGESGLGLGEREHISRMVKPEPGHVTLFPSYFWHGTVPFQSAEPRITTPFDVTPMA